MAIEALNGHDTRSAAVYSKNSANGTVRPHADIAPRDLLPRRRDRWGNRLPWRCTVAAPPTADIPLDRTPLAAAVAEVAAVRPLLAMRLRHF